MHELQDIFALMYAVDLSQLEAIIREAERIRVERERLEQLGVGAAGHGCITATMNVRGFSNNNKNSAV